MFRLLNKLFKWDYIVWEYSYNAEIARVHVDGEGNPYVLRYNKYPIQLFSPKEYKITWLTCPPQKYSRQKLLPYYPNGD